MGRMRMGGPDFITSFLYDISPEEEIYSRMIYSLKLGIEALGAGKWRNMPIWFVAGEEGTGKTLLSEVFARALGGHSPENCFKFLCGKTDENTTLAGTSVWKVDDQVADYHVRDTFFSNLKSAQADSAYQLKTLYSDKFTAKTFRTIMILTNMNPAGLTMLPDSSEHGGFYKKVIAFQARKTGILDGRERDSISADLDREIRMFRRYCLDFTPPPAITSGERTGVKSYWDEDLLMEASMSSPWSGRLRDIFNEHGPVCGEGEYFALTQHDLETFITDREDEPAGRKLWGKITNLFAVPRELATRWPHIIKQHGDLWVFRDGPDALGTTGKPWPETFTFKRHVPAAAPQPYQT